MSLTPRTRYACSFRPPPSNVGRGQKGCGVQARGDVLDAVQGFMVLGNYGGASAGTRGIRLFCL